MGLDFTNAHGQARVLDDILVSPELCAQLTHYESIEVGGFSTHCLVSATFDFQSELPQNILDRFLSPQKAGEPGRCAEQAGMTQGEWWASQMQGFQLYTPQTDAPTEGSCSRGQATHKHVHHVKKAECEYEPWVWYAHVARKAYAHLKEARDLQLKGKADEPRCLHLLRKFRALPLEGVGLMDMQGIDHVEEAHDLRAMKVSQDDTRTTRQRMLEWRHDMIQSVLDGSASVFKWLKHGADALAVVTDGCRIVAHPPKIMELIHEFWAPILDPPGYVPASEQTL
eukprot:3140152-Amphidinium_carterae.1